MNSVYLNSNYLKLNKPMFFKLGEDLCVSVFGRLFLGGLAIWILRQVELSGRSENKSMKKVNFVLRARH